ncbi:MAG: polymerase sigma-70 factor, subfamily [Acidimicrobiaceae bacterium]|jgi:RNA polymerase sigma-70 factor (ECF subfamily)|nr:polymerase sigma-70 factor, subfamily [Acidimicrobiaceae bacterium]MDQ1377365.1 polymerase sigma-70 factor, subfamily [Acidimicrobiaceae bacterium]MDQ1420300.1 polymerase sigma-70 factor, subfamily [Acidimicrobiaceae bacterium]
MSIQQSGYAAAADKTLAAASDGDLAEALRGRDTEALGETYRRHASVVAATARRIGGGYHVDDVVQDVFLLLWRAPERFHPERGSLAKYLVTMTRGTTLDRIRSDGARNRRHLAYGFQTVSLHSVDDAVMAGVTTAEVQTALRSLPTNERIAIERAFFGGESYRQVAAKLQEPEGTVKSRIRTGLRRLEAELRPSDAPEAD